MAAPDNPNLQAPQVPPNEPWPPPPVADFVKRHRAETASRIAGWLLVILAGSLVLHYTSVTILILCKRDDALKVVEDIFHSWLPVLSGLAGAAATYYFTREEK